MPIDPSWCTAIIDLSHHQKHDFDWGTVFEAGVIAVIHKATEGSDFADERYHERRAGAKASRLLWGAYHFSGPDGSGGVEQADHFIDFAKPTDDEFICFDCEKHGTYEDMLSFVERVRERLGRYPAIYGRRLLREHMRGRGGSPVNRGVLWYDEYPPPNYNAPRQALPEGWDDWTLWQYTNGRDGPEPREIEGLGSFDRNAFKGTAEQLRAQWPFLRS